MLKIIKTLMVLLLLQTSVLVAVGSNLKQASIRLMQKEEARIASDALIGMLLTERDDAILERDKALAEQDDLELSVAEALEKINTLVAFRESGLTENVCKDDLKDLLSLTEHIPYGSPFKAGHWITSPFGLRDESSIGGDNYTEGLDMVGKNGDRIVRTTADGVIIDHGISEVYGLYVIVQHAGGVRSQYSHLSKIYWQDIDTQKVRNIPIKRGSRLGVMGNTGLCMPSKTGDGSHLDYRISIKAMIEGEETYLPLNPTAIANYTGGSHE